MRRAALEARRRLWVRAQDSLGYWDLIPAIELAKDGRRFVSREVNSAPRSFSSGSFLFSCQARKRF